MKTKSTKPMPETLAIESGIEIPPRKAKNSGIMSRTLLAMKVGDSFVYDRKSLAGVMHASKRTGVKVTTRKLDNGAFRVWRVKS